jgi:hypothetical protein
MKRTSLLLVVLLTAAMAVGFQTAHMSKFTAMNIDHSQLNSSTVGNLVPGPVTATTLGSTGAVTLGGRLTENAGVVNTGTGFKHMRVGGCTTPATTNGTCSTVPNWPSAFADTNYTAVCVSENSAAYVLGVGSHTTTTINVNIVNAPGVSTAVAPTLDCVGIHD